MKNKIMNRKKIRRKIKFKASNLNKSKINNIRKNNNIIFNKDSPVKMIIIIWNNLRIFKMIKINNINILKNFCKHLIILLTRSIFILFFNYFLC